MVRLSTGCVWVQAVEFTFRPFTPGKSKMFHILMKVDLTNFGVCFGMQNKKKQGANAFVSQPD